MQWREAMAYFSSEDADMIRRRTLLTGQGIILVEVHGRTTAVVYGSTSGSRWAVKTPETFTPSNGQVIGSAEFPFEGKY